MLGLINEFSEVVGYISIYKNLLHFLVTYYAVSEREIKKTISFTIPSKRIKYIGINLTRM